MLALIHHLSFLSSLYTTSNQPSIVVSTTGPCNWLCLSRCNSMFKRGRRYIFTRAVCVCLCLCLTRSESVAIIHACVRCMCRCSMLVLFAYLFVSLVSVSLCTCVRVDPQCRWAIESSSTGVVPVPCPCPIVILSHRISYQCELDKWHYGSIVFHPSVPHHFSICLFFFVFILFQPRYIHTPTLSFSPSPIHHHSETQTRFCFEKKRSSLCLSTCPPLIHIDVVTKKER